MKNYPFYSFMSVVLIVLVTVNSNPIANESQIQQENNKTNLSTKECNLNQTPSYLVRSLSSAVVIVGIIFSFVFCVGIFHLLYNDVNFLPSIRNRRRV